MLPDEDKIPDSFVREEVERLQGGNSMRRKAEIEYRVIPVTRFMVCRYEDTGQAGGSSTKGEFQNERGAYDVAYALCRAEHSKLGYPIDDPRIRYPEPPMSSVREPVMMVGGSSTQVGAFGNLKTRL